MTAVRTAFVIAMILILPGWAVLSLSGIWRRWEQLQRWIVAVGLSIALYPVLFYTTRFLLPSLTFGPYKMSAMLLVCAGVIGWQMRRDWKDQFRFDNLEWIAIAIFAMTMFTRFWIIRDHPYPAWSDSLHHALLTRLTAFQGQLPTTMEPYYPIPLDQYHLGLYSLTATTQWLAQVPAHTALLWTAQALNGLCGLGVYLVLDRKSGRVGAIAGAAVVGLLSHQPAYYVNWGRFTQLSSQTILLIAWLMTWEAIRTWRESEREHRAEVAWQTGFGAVLTAAVFLLHFRVAAFYLPLLAMSVGWEVWRGSRERQLGHVLLRTAVVGVVALALVSPVLWTAGRAYVQARAEPVSFDISQEEIEATRESLYEFGWRALPDFGGRLWLLGLAILGLAIGLLKRDKLVIAFLIWVIALYLMGMAYVLDIPILSFTNLGAVLILLYLPIALILGSAIREVSAFIPSQFKDRAVNLVLICIFAAGFTASHVRVAEIEPMRHFVTPADVAAMDWIRVNTPGDALFAVNTYFWMPYAPHGTDGGYWIPYFADRQTTAGAMIVFINIDDYGYQLVEMSRAVERLEESTDSLAELQALGVNYIYAGQMGDFSGPGIDAMQIAEETDVDIAYQNGGVIILQLP